MIILLLIIYIMNILWHFSLLVFRMLTKHHSLIHTRALSFLTLLHTHSLLFSLTQTHILPLPLLHHQHYDDYHRLLSITISILLSFIEKDYNLGPFSEEAALLVLPVVFMSSCRIRSISDTVYTLCLASLVLRHCVCLLPLTCSITLRRGAL